MKNSFEIKLKDEKDPTIWARFVQWLNGHDQNPFRIHAGELTQEHADFNEVFAPLDHAVHVRKRFEEIGAFNSDLHAQPATLV